MPRSMAKLVVTRACASWNLGYLFRAKYLFYGQNTSLAFLEALVLRHVERGEGVDHRFLGWNLRSRLAL